jgi:hypothetical protein
MFYGIIVRMYTGTGEHVPPHIHVYYQDYQAVFRISDANLIEGALPPRQTRLVEAWMEIHKDELAADWRLAQAGEQLFKIQPLE